MRTLGKTLLTTLLLVTAGIFLATFTGCAEVTGASGEVDTLYIGYEQPEFGNAVVLIFSLKGLYTMYDVETGAQVYSYYKDNSAWAGEGYDTMSVTLPDTVITYRYDHTEAPDDNTVVNVNGFTEGAYTYGDYYGWELNEAE